MKKSTKTGKADKTHGEIQSQHGGSHGNVSCKSLRDIAIAELVNKSPFFSWSPLQAHSLYNHLIPHQVLDVESDLLTPGEITVFWSTASKTLVLKLSCV